MYKCNRVGTGVAKRREGLEWQSGGLSDPERDRAAARPPTVRFIDNNKINVERIYYRYSSINALGLDYTQKNMRCKFFAKLFFKKAEKSLH